MGDPLRFNLFADLVTKTFPQHIGNDIADVAGGKGGLKAALYLRGWRRVTVIDVRHRQAKHRPGQHYGRFKHDDWRRWSLVLGMHPDEATDNIVLYAVRNKVPFAVCPCCIKPDAAPYYGGLSSKKDWLRHVEALALSTHIVRRVMLPMHGDNVALLGEVRR